MNRLRLLVQTKHHALRLDSFLAQVAPALKHTALSKLIRKKDIDVLIPPDATHASQVDDCIREKAQLGTRIQKGQVIELPAFCRFFLSETGFAISNIKEVDPSLQPSEIISTAPSTSISNLRSQHKLASQFTSWIVYEDESVIVINKPNGVPVQASDNTKSQSTLMHIDQYLEALFEVGDSRPPPATHAWRGPITCTTLTEKPKLVHRLDSDCSGVLVLAKSREAAAFFTEAFKTGSQLAVDTRGASKSERSHPIISRSEVLGSDEKKIRKVYWANVYPTPDWDSLFKQPFVQSGVQIPKRGSRALSNPEEQSITEFETWILMSQSFKALHPSLSRNAAAEILTKACVNLPLLKRNPSAKVDFYSAASSGARAQLLLAGHVGRTGHKPLSQQAISNVTEWPYPTLDPSVAPGSSLYSELVEANMLYTAVSLAAEIRPDNLHASKDGFKHKKLATTLALSPMTGRKHQLRLHCAAALRSPIIGDTKYSTRRPGLLANYPHLESLVLDSLKRELGPTTPSHVLATQVQSVFNKLHLHCRAMSFLLPTNLVARPRTFEGLKGSDAPPECITVYAEPPLHMLRLMSALWNVKPKYASYWELNPK